jgi:hypothetical protein
VIDEALERKRRSEALLSQRGIPYIDHLPAIETEDEIALRGGEEAMRRAMCLFAVSHAAISNGVTTARELLARWEADDALSPHERAFLHSDPLPEKARVQFSWRCEALIPLMWATGLFDEMPFPDDCFDFEFLTEFWLGVPSGFSRDVGLRDVAEILDQADLVYRLHWAARDADLKGEAPPGGLHLGVVMERHHALNWLIGYAEAEWDDVTTDT